MQSSKNPRMPKSTKELINSKMKTINAETETVSAQKKPEKGVKGAKEKMSRKRIICQHFLCSLVLTLKGNWICVFENTKKNAKKGSLNHFPLVKIYKKEANGTITVLFEKFDGNGHIPDYVKREVTQSESLTSTEFNTKLSYVLWNSKYYVFNYSKSGSTPCVPILRFIRNELLEYSKDEYGINLRLQKGEQSPLSELIDNQESGLYKELCHFFETHPRKTFCLDQNHFNANDNTALYTFNDIYNLIYTEDIHNIPESSEIPSQDNDSLCSSPPSCNSSPIPSTPQSANLENINNVNYSSDTPIPEQFVDPQFSLYSNNVEEPHSFNNIQIGTKFLPLQPYIHNGCQQEYYDSIPNLMDSCNYDGLNYTQMSYYSSFNSSSRTPQYFHENANYCINYNLSENAQTQQSPPIISNNNNGYELPENTQTQQPIPFIANYNDYELPENAQETSYQCFDPYYFSSTSQFLL
ncbi:hypothetical protein QTN25_007614 [Entamoeba marina]